MRQHFFRIVSAMLLVATVSLTGYAQGGGSTASLMGSVVDQSGGVVPGATIVAKNDATGTEFNTVTAENGTFTIPAMPVGTYTVTVGAVGFKQFIVEKVKMDAGVPANIRRSQPEMLSTSWYSSPGSTRPG
jgi:hypothetical protein